MQRKVLMTIKVFPESVDIELDDLLESIRSAFPGEKVIPQGKEYIGYGIAALVIDLTAPERDGVSQEYEEKLKGIQGVGEISIENVRKFVDVRKPG